MYAMASRRPEAGVGLASAGRAEDDKKSTKRDYGSSQASDAKGGSRRRCADVKNVAPPILNGFTCGSRCFERFPVSPRM